MSFLHNKRANQCPQPKAQKTRSALSKSAVELLLLSREPEAVAMCVLLLGVGIPIPLSLAQLESPMCCCRGQTRDPRTDLV